MNSGLACWLNTTIITVVSDRSHSLPSRQLHLRPGSPMNGVLEGRTRRRLGVFGGGRFADTHRHLRRIARPIGDLFARAALSKPSGGLAKRINDLATSAAPNTPNLRHACLVLEGRETLAGGATTGSSATPTLSSRRAPAGAREACGDSTSPSCARFSRPFRALASSTMGNRVDPVVAPPANFFRASGMDARPDQFPGVRHLIPTCNSNLT